MHRDAEQRGRDRPLDEGRRDAHCVVLGVLGRAAPLGASALLALAVASPPCVALAFGARPVRAAASRPALRSGRLPSALAPHRVPSASRAKPVVTTRSPPSRPVAITARRSSCCATVTGRTATLSVVLDHVDERAVRPALHRRGRHHDDLAQRVDQQAHIDELARPELQIGIGKLGLEPDRAGGLIDLVVDHQHLAVVERAACRRRRSRRPAAAPRPCPC